MPRGRTPKRSAEVMGHRTRKEMAERVLDSAPGAENVVIPEPDDEWHPIAYRWYESLTESGQSKFYEPSDWALAVFVTGEMDKCIRASSPSPTMFKAILDAAAQLLSTEGSRRRLRLELMRPEFGGQPADQAPGVAAMADYKKRLRG